jgi:outer membrane protease
MKKKILMLIIVATLGLTVKTMAQVPSYVPTNGLIGYFGFNNNGNDQITSSVPSSNNASSTTDRFGNSNSAYQFGGSSVIKYTNSSHPLFRVGNTYQTFTMNFWIKPTVTGNGFILGAFRGWGWFVQLDNNKVNFSYISSYSPTTWTSLTSISSITQNTWQMITITRTGSANSVFINGVLDNTTYGPNIWVFINSTWWNMNCWFGANGQDNGSYFSGDIDDVAIWNRALTPCEVATLYSSGTIPLTNIIMQDTISACGSSLSVTAAAGYSSYLWSNGDNTASTTVTQSGWYSVTASNGTCTTTDSVYVSLLNAQIQQNDTTVCAGTNLSLSLASSSSPSNVCDPLPANLQNGLVSYWPFCGNANDESGNGNNGTVNGATLTTDRFGDANHAYSFNGVSNYITIPPNSSFIQLPMTYSFWYSKSGPGNICPSTNTESWQMFFSTGSYSQSRDITISPNNKIGIERSIPTGCNNELTLQAYFNNNTWNHAVIVYESNLVTIYLNGTSIGSINVNCASTTANTTNYIGASNPLIWACVGYVNGKIDDFIIWNRVLSQSEISQLDNFSNVAPTSTYLWSSGDTTSTINVSPSQTTTYYCTVSNGITYCVDSVTVTVSQPTIVASATSTNVCAGASSTLNATGGTTYTWMPGNLTGSPVVTPTSTTTYTVTGTNAIGCMNTSTIEVAVYPLPTATLTPAGPTTFCQGGSVVLNANVGTGLTYQWYNGATPISGANSSSYTATASGAYNVQVSTSNCTATSINQSVTVNTLPTATLTPAGPTTFCQGGSVVLNANAGTGLTYQWYNGATLIIGANSSSYTATASGAYNVQVSTSNCAATSISQSVTVNPLPIATLTPVGPTTFCQGGSVVLNANVGTGLTYQWYNGATLIIGANSSSYTATASGAYNVQVSTSNCTATSINQSVTVNTLPTATLTPAGPTTFCQGGSVVLNANVGTGLTYQWYNGATLISGANSSSYTATASGAYNVQVSTSNCTATSINQSVTVNPLPTATLSPAGPTTFCQGGSVVLNANVGAGLTYQWYNGATPISGANSLSYTATTSGAYNVQVSTSNCTATSINQSVTVNPLPTATLTPAGPTTFCQGGSVVLNANVGTGLTYQWYNGATSISGANSSSYTATASGTYNVQVSTSNCTTTSINQSVTVNPLPIATLTPVGPTTFCQGGSVVLNANAGTGLTYQWYNGATPISGANSSSYTATTSGAYNVQVSTSNCTATSINQSVTVNPLPTATLTPAGPTTFCQGGSVVLNANFGTGLTYQWYNGATLISGANSSSYTATTSGAYNVQVSTSNCTATSINQSVTVNPLPIATLTPAGPTTFCQGGSVVLNANFGTGLTYQWYNGATLISGANSSSYTATTSGAYNVQVSTSNCTATSINQSVTVNPLPIATLTPVGPTTFCQGGSVVLNANVGTGLTYQWYNGATLISGANSSSYTATASGTYNVQVSTSNCTTTSINQSVTVNPLPIATLTPVGPTTFCQGGSVVLNANAGTGLTYQWYNGATPISGANSSSYTATTSGAYNVQVSTSNCTTTSINQSVTVNPLPIATLTPAGPTTFCQGGSVVLNANVGTGLTYQWYNGAALISGSTNSSYVATVGGTYNVQVSNGSCSATSLNQNVSITILNLTLGQSGSSIWSNTAGASYQWINCKDNSIIQGAIGQGYTVTTGGTFAVIITQDGCTDTSNCVTVIGVGTLDYSHLNQVQLYPNPTSGKMILNSIAPFDDALITILDLTGQIVCVKKHIFLNKVEFDLSQKSKGVYIVQLEEAGKIKRIKLLLD